MGSLRQDLLSAAQAAVREDLLRRPPFLGHAGLYGVVLGGSGVTDDIDEFSGCDLIVFRLPRDGAAKRPSAGRGSRPAAAAGWIDVRRVPHLYRYAILDFTPFAEAVLRGDDEALYLLRYGQILHDPRGRLAQFWTGAPTPDAAMWRGKLAYRYRAFRQRRASLAWSLRRGQPLQVLDNLRLLLEHTLCCCYYLQHEPAPPRKWMFRGALRTPAGRVLREPMLELLSSLGELATLGGSLTLSQNRLYHQAGRLQDALEQALQAAGLPVPGLAAHPAARGDGQAGGAEGTESRAPRARSRRRQSAVGGGEAARRGAGAGEVGARAPGAPSVPGAADGP